MAILSLAVGTLGFGRMGAPHAGGREGQVERNLKCPAELMQSTKKPLPRPSTGPDCRTKRSWSMSWMCFCMRRGRVWRSTECCWGAWMACDYYQSRQRPRVHCGSPARREAPVRQRPNQRTGGAGVLFGCETATQSLVMELGQVMSAHRIRYGIPTVRKLFH